jgi:hypothetical protein
MARKKKPVATYGHSTTPARLLQQPHTALYASQPSWSRHMLVSQTWCEVHAGLVVRMLNAGNTTTCLLPRCVLGLGISGVVPPIWRYLLDRLRH